MDRSSEVAGEQVAGEAPADWWRGAVIYENHLPSVRDGNGDGIGDLTGLIESLDYLGETLGVDAIWVGPFFPSPLLDQGFDITDFTDVNPIFGDLDTFDRLIEEAHRRGLRILVDYVPNHTSDQHPWFAASRSSREASKRNWYVWADPSADGGPPNNWTSEAGGSVWELDATTGQYYLHSHLVEQPDLNWREPAVREALLDVLRFWLDRGADGFRIDVAHMLMKDPELRDNPPAPEGAVGNVYDIQHPDFASQLHVHDRRHPDVHDVLAEIRAVLDEYGDRVTIGEIEAMGWQDWAEYYGRRLDGLHLPFAFQLIETPWEAEAQREAIAGLEGALPQGAWPVLALGNHDRKRLATRIGRDQARVAAVLLLTLRGSPTLLYGDELGMVDQDVPRERQRDHFAFTTGGISRDPTRTPMAWTGGPTGGFSTAAPKDMWLPVNREVDQINVEAQLANPDSSLNLYRRLIALRRESAAIHHGSYEAIEITAADCISYERVDRSDRKLIALNLSADPVEIQLDARGMIVISTHRAHEGRRVDGAIELAGSEGVVIDTDPGADR
ncbi:MAG: alpha-glucosidase [Solirubrobacteraceae bacterium]|nr:alpha-glucosidase [Solirubrobacteraceae bacterium]